MKNKGYTEAVGDARLFSDLMGTTIDRVEGVLRSGRNKLNQINGAYLQLERTLINTKNSADRMCTSESRRRNDTARKAVERIKVSLSAINDPHFHRMEKEYVRNYGRGTYAAENDTPYTVYRKLSDAMGRLDKLVGDLNHAFIPPAISGAIGAVARPYRKDSYLKIIKVRDEVLALAEALINFSDVTDQQQECGQVFNERLEREKGIRDSKLHEIPDEVRQGVTKAYELFAQGIEGMHKETDILNESERSIVVGQCWFYNENASVLAEAGLSGEKSVDLRENGVGFRLQMDSIKENMLFMCESGQSLAPVLCSLSTDILYTCNHMEIILVDIKGLGSSYRQLQPINGLSALTILNTDAQVGDELKKLEKWIADTYEKCLGERYVSLDDYNSVSLSKRTRKCLVIDDLIGNIESKYYDQIVRIMNNGVKAGVNVLCSVENKEYGNNRQIIEFLMNIRAAAIAIPVRKNGILINSCTRLFLKASPDRKRIEAVKFRLESKEEESAEIHIGRALPPNGQWQKKSSAKRIIVDFGIDENGKEISFEISSEKPYGLIIGDVRVGKSSLLHTIIFQLLANYSPEEVRIAVGDFKDGADFNVYAKGNLKSVDTVINDEDPDAMLSFLKYYVQEMQLRQRMFEQMEDMAGVIVQKYEDFRNLYDGYRDNIPAMPRIVILVDEFQSLFDGASCTAYMTELVRKGATYGIHVILSSQRAVSDNPRNGFTASLKDYFTSRFVFKTPQNAARSMLAERCADTGRENTGIQKASLLKKGHAVYNSYMGQNESDNAVVQCYYASRETIATFIRVIGSMNGEGRSILLKRNAKSTRQPQGDGLLRLGRSVAYHRDAVDVDIDTVLDDIEVSVNPQRVRNMVLSGADERILKSIVSSVVTWREHIRDKRTQLHIFGEYETLGGRHVQNIHVHYHKTIQEQLEELERQKNSSNSDYVINVFVQPDKYSGLTQSAGSIRSNPGVEAMKQVLEKCGKDYGFSIIYAKLFKNVRSNMPYLMNVAPIHITSVGDMENLKYAMSDSVRLTSSDFDVPNKNAIKAYYYNRDTEKAGKVILYRP